MKDLISNYQLLKIPSANILAPRQGYYALDLPRESVKSNGINQILVNALWTNDLLSSTFIEVFLNIRPLYNQCAIGPNGTNYTELKDKVIHIQDIKLVESNYNGTESKIYQVEWNIVGSIDKAIELSKVQSVLDDYNYYENEALLNDDEFTQQLRAEQKFFLDELIFSSYENEQTDDEAEIKWLLAEELIEFYQSLELSEGDILSQLDQSDRYSVENESNDSLHTSEELID